MVNLNFPKPIEDPAHFFDREEALAAISEHLKNPQRPPIIIKGERLVGKTSTLNVTLVQHENDQSVVLRLPQVNSRREFFDEVLSGLDLHFPEQTIPFERATRTNTAFATTLEQLLRAHGKELLLVLDELDSMFHECSPGEAQKLLSTFLYLIERPTLPVRFLFTMSTTPQQFIQSYLSPFLALSKFVPLPFWSFEEIRDFTQWLLGSYVRFDPDALQLLYQGGGGHPYFTKALLKTLTTPLLNRLPRINVRKAEMTQAIESTVQEQNVNFALRNLWAAHFTPEEKHILQQLAREGRPVPEVLLTRDEPKQRMALHILLERQYLQHQRGDIWFRLGLLYTWLRLWVPLEPEDASDRSKLIVNTRVRTVQIDDSTLTLTEQEYQLLLLLARKRGEPVSREEIARLLWPEEEEAEGVPEDRISKTIGRLRQKLGDSRKNPYFLKTVRRKGYMLDHVRLID
ncbi:MAG: winged helix-turn-helix transcriptional regulator [Chloroflexi bacterium]|nr:winged helix-turn-helix transcriptional regulator [Chloroflexota bacterium]